MTALLAFIEGIGFSATELSMNSLYAMNSENIIRNNFLHDLGGATADG
jgi:hypothetical protein